MERKPYNDNASPLSSSEDNMHTAQINAAEGSLIILDMLVSMLKFVIGLVFTAVVVVPAVMECVRIIWG